jgi:hypothetical protein
MSAEGSGEKGSSAMIFRRRTESLLLKPRKGVRRAGLVVPSGVPEGLKDAQLKPARPHSKSSVTPAFGGPERMREVATPRPMKPFAG